MSIRTARVAEEIQKVLGERLIRGLRDPLPGFVTIKDVEVTSDFTHAKVFVSVFGSDAQKKAAIDGLIAQRGFLRGEVGKNIRLRNTPNLSFILDESSERAARVHALLDEVRDGKVAKFVEPTEPVKVAAPPKPAAPSKPAVVAPPKPSPFAKLADVAVAVVKSVLAPEAPKVDVKKPATNLAPEVSRPVPSKGPAASIEPTVTAQIEHPSSMTKATKKPAAQVPVAPKPVDPKPVAPKPVAKKPVAKKPVAKKPVAKKPVAKKAPAKKAPVKKPVAKKTAAKKAPAKKAPAKKTTAKQPAAKTTTSTKKPAKKVAKKKAGR